MPSVKWANPSFVKWKCIKINSIKILNSIVSQSPPYNNNGHVIVFLINSSTSKREEKEQQQFAIISSEIWRHNIRSILVYCVCIYVWVLLAMPVLQLESRLSYWQHSWHITIQLEQQQYIFVQIILYVVEELKNQRFNE